MPLLGIGVAGLKVSILVPIISLVRHWGYGMALAWLYPLPQHVRSTQTTCCVPEGIKA